MGEVVCSLNDKEIGRYTPYCEMLKSGCNETYEAVGEHLMLAYELHGEITTPSNLLVSLRGGREVVFRLGECISIGSVE